MMNLEELWIGDLLQIVSSGKVGKYEGKTHDGKAKIRHYNQIINADADDLRKYYPPKKEATIELEEIDEQTPSILPDEIDLHIEVLNPSLQDARPERIRDYQVKAFEEYLEKLKASVLNEATIIHGKGTGVLKEEILSIIKNDKTIKLYEEVHDGGAVRILI